MGSSAELDTFATFAKLSHMCEFPETSSSDEEASWHYKQRILLFLLVIKR